VGRRRKMTVSELVEMGYDPDKLITASSTEPDMAESSPERVARNSDQGTEVGEGSTADEASREVIFTEWYDTVDVDGDGIAERRKFCMIGDTEYEILDNEESDIGHPYATLCPFPMPHKFFGESLSDKTSDLQRLSSTLWRQINDNLYLSNTPRMIAIGDVNIDDLLNTRIGAVIRGKANATVAPVVTPFVAAPAFQMLEYLDHVRGQRTGITEYSQGLDADTLNKTATGISMIQSAAQQRQELIARIFAETGVKRLFWLVLHLVTKYQKKAQVIKLRDQQFVPMDPREWTNKMDLTVSVGIGTGNKQVQTQQMMQLLQMDLEIVKLQGGLEGPLVNGENVYHKFEKLLQSMGQKTAAGFYTNPKDAPPIQPKPDPEVEKAKALLQIKAQEAQQSAALETQKAQAQMQLAQAQAQQEMQLERERAQHEFVLEELRLQNELKIARLKASADIQLKGFTAAANAEIRANQPPPQSNA
jgi:hypothetical protein